MVIRDLHLLPAKFHRRPKNESVEICPRTRQEASWGDVAHGLWVWNRWKKLIWFHTYSLMLGVSKLSTTDATSQKTFPIVLISSRQWSLMKGILIFFNCIRSPVSFERNMAINHCPFKIQAACYKNWVICMSNSFSLLPSLCSQSPLHLAWLLTWLLCIVCD